MRPAGNNLQTLFNKQKTNNFEDLINFYTKLMKNSDKMHTEIKKYLNEDIFKKFQVKALDQILY